MMQDLSPINEPAHHDGYRLVISPDDKRYRTAFLGATIADSTHVRIMREARYAPVVYFPRGDVAMDRLIPSDLRTHCPFKGNATYWHIEVDGQRIENAAWSYEQPFDEATSVKGHIAFYWEHLDEWTVDGKLMPKPAPLPVTDGNPLSRWLLDQASRATSVQALLTDFAETLRNNNFPLWRARILIQTLNPLLFARGFTWQADTDAIAEFQATHAGRNSPQYQDSPFAAIMQGEGGIRRHLEGDNARLDYPILQELVTEGATDYVAMPMRYADGQINILVLVSNVPGGFSTEQLGQIYEVLGALSRFVELHAERISAATLLETYLGRNAGRMVMQGQVQRGHAQDLEAVIWLADLRDSTTLANTLRRDDYLAALSDYYDSVAGAVLDQGGDVLKFIGDAVLAVFPVEAAGGQGQRAYDRALNAVTEATARMTAVNKQREQSGAYARLRFGVGLHCDTLTFGNVGSPARLDFTVIGPGVNKAARIAEICKNLRETALVSEKVAAHASGNLKSIGHHELRGFDAHEELFKLST